MPSRAGSPTWDFQYLRNALSRAPWVELQSGVLRPGESARLPLSPQQVLEQERSRLDPRTVRALEKNLKIIDRAVADARRAVDADPSSLYLREHLASMMKQKVSLLRQATMLASQG